MAKSNRRQLLISLGLIAAALVLAYFPIAAVRTPLIIVSGSELEEPLQVLAQQFQQQHPHIQIVLKTQGSLDMVNRLMSDQNDFHPNILIPANGELLKTLETRWQAQYGASPFSHRPQAVAKTRLVAMAWPERGQALFPDGVFRWERVEAALKAGSWGSFGGSSRWGSFDFAMTDPTRSNSGQLTLSLWLASKLQQSQLSSSALSRPDAQALVRLVKRSVYQPARSSDILLQEFIAKGANDGDLAVDYESVALYRWSQSKVSQPQPYQIYEISPTVETLATAAIIQGKADQSAEKAAQQFIDFMLQPAQQVVLVRFGFRPVNLSVQLDGAESPWQTVPGAQTKPSTAMHSAPPSETLQEISRLWDRASS